MKDKKKIVIVIGIIVAIVIVAIIAGFALKGINKTNKILSGKNNGTQTEDTKKKQATVVNLGEKISNSEIDMTFESVDFKEEIEWRMSKYSTRSESIGDGKLGLSISGVFKNLKGDAIKESDIIGKVVIDGKYTYDLSFTPHVSGFSVEPLESVEYDFYAKVPQEIRDSYSKIEFTFGYNNDFETIVTRYVNGKKVDPFESLDNLYSLTVTK